MLLSLAMIFSEYIAAARSPPGWIRQYDDLDMVSLGDIKPDIISPDIRRQSAKPGPVNFPTSE